MNTFVLVGFQTEAQKTVVVVVVVDDVVSLETA